jgi:N-acetylmuramoyl-L-alanine amidase
MPARRRRWRIGLAVALAAACVPLVAASSPPRRHHARNATSRRPSASRKSSAASAARRSPAPPSVPTAPAEPAAATGAAGRAAAAGGAGGSASPGAGTAQPGALAVSLHGTGGTTAAPAAGAGTVAATTTAAAAAAAAATAGSAAAGAGPGAAPWTADAGSLAGGGPRTGGSGSPAGSGGAGPPAPAAVPPPIPRQGLRLRLADGVDAAVSGDGRIAVEAVPRRGEGLAGFAQRMCGDARFAPRLVAANPRRSASSLKTGLRYRVPFELLAATWQLAAAQALFPEDRGDATGWRHQVRGCGPLRRENLWQLSEWFTGKGENFRAIREYNSLRDEDLARGAVLTIPSELLRPAFATALPVPRQPLGLQYGRDQEGEYAVYRLRPGEALYSAVVVRFTGRIYAADVNALAADIAHRSGIDDVTSIPVGFKVKVPLDLLLPEFLPEGDPRRKEYEAGLRASSHFSNQVQARGLEGITVILDPGHGGHDSGAAMGGVWESLYVYDIAVRLRRLLESRTAAAALLTTRDGDDYRIVDADVLPPSRRHAVLTNPPYPIEDPVVGVNLRWYLANSFFRRALAGDNDPQKVVFLSIHADSLHPSLRGAMAYIPAARMRHESYAKSGAIYEARQEFRESPRVEFPWEQRVQSEGLSRQLAKQVIAAFEELGLPVQAFTPVRDHIIRNRGEWVPAVLRYNSVPAKMLLEVCNLNNDLDRRLVQTRAYRQRVAEALLQGLLAYYGEGAAQPPAQRVASAAR